MVSFSAAHPCWVWQLLLKHLDASHQVDGGMLIRNWYIYARALVAWYVSFSFSNLHSSQLLHFSANSVLEIHFQNSHIYATELAGQLQQ